MSLLQAIRRKVRSPHEDTPVCMCGILTCTCITVRAFGWLLPLFKFWFDVSPSAIFEAADNSSVVGCDCVGRVAPDVSGDCTVYIFSNLGLFDPYIRGHNTHSKRQ
jgi:hypothetical protein